MSLKKIELYSIIAGLVFLISGILKSLDSAFFANIIIGYGLGNWQFLSPMIILLEVLLGLKLVFQIKTRWTAAAGSLLIVFFTLIYLYGFLFQGVKDCGCFGRVSIFNKSLWVVLARNAVLLYFLISLWLQKGNVFIYNKWTCIFILGFMCMVAFMAGYTYEYTPQNKTKQMKLQDSVLNEYVLTSSDSTYLVFVFSYTCPHCLNSISNVNGYVKSGVVDRVIGLAVGDAEAERFFTESFHPEFSITTYPPGKFHLTNKFPKAYYIKDNEIIMELSGPLPCAYIFQYSLNGA